MSSCPASTVGAVVPVRMAYYTGLEERWQPPLQPRGGAVLEQPAVASFAAVAFRCISFQFQLPP